MLAVGGAVMEYSVLGRTGLRVSRLGLGGAPLGGDYGAVTDREVAEVVDAAIDEGINVIDTAPLYGSGDSERRIGRALTGKRNEVVLATKAVMRGEPYSYENTLRSVESSLRRLNTDWVDIIQVHEPGATTYEQIMNETVPAFLKLREQGKVRWLGINERNLDQLVRFMKTDVFDVLQFYTRYMLIDCTAKDEVLPLARRMNIGVINGSVLGMGVLAGVTHMLEGYPALLEEANRRMAELAFLRRPGSSGLIEPAMRFSLTCPDIAVTLTGVASAGLLRRNAGYCDGEGLAEHELNRIFSLFQGRGWF